MIVENIDDLEYDYIVSLKDDKIPESDVLDYKKIIPEDKELTKHVSAFANTHGGHIIFGIEESGGGGYPIAINGISEKINKERNERIILSNIFPRLQIKQKIVENEKGNPFLILQIPDSGHKPHFDNKSQRYYKRFQFESAPMQEQEVSDMYKNKFHNLNDIKEYLKMSVLQFPLTRNDQVQHSIIQILQAQIIVTPIVLNNNLIDVTKDDMYDKLKPNIVDYEPSGYHSVSRSSFLPGSPTPHKLGIFFKSPDEKTALAVHRNGCIQHILDIGYDKDIQHSSGIPKVSFMRLPVLAVKLMHVLQFAEDIFSRYNYFGDAEILVKLQSSNHVWGLNYPKLDVGYKLFYPTKIEPDEGPSPNVDMRTLSVERNFPSSYLKPNFSKIASSIMDEIYNCFKIRKCPLFDKDGQYIEEELRKVL